MFFEHIKYVLGDYFITDINKVTYCFKLEGSRIQTYTQKGIKSCRLIDYNTSHYLPVSAENVKEIQNVLVKNSLPKINEKLAKIFRILGSREKQANDGEAFPPHELKNLMKELKEHENEYKDEVQNMINYLSHLKVDHIITPVRKISEFIEGDLKETDPKFLGDIVSAYQRTDMEHKHVTNKPITGKMPWLKIIAIVAIIGIVIGVGFWLYDSGLIPTGIPGLGPDKPTMEEITAKYSPEELRAAIDRGEVKYDDLPKEVQKMVDSVKLPTVD